MMSDRGAKPKRGGTTIYRNRLAASENKTQEFTELTTGFATRSGPGPKQNPHGTIRPESLNPVYPATRIATLPTRRPSYPNYHGDSRKIC